MDGFAGKCRLISACALAAVMLAGCAAPKPKDFSGHWQPVNHFGTTTTAIPLQRAYTYFASPLDATLKALLERWAGDTGMRVDYRLRDDYTLYTPVSAIHTADVVSALAQLNQIYAAQDVSITVNRGAFVVDAKPPTVPAASIPTPAQTTPGAPAPSQSEGKTPPRGAG